MPSLPPILLDDDLLLAFDKPADLLVTPDRQEPGVEDLMKQVHQEKSWEYVNVHRLDRMASGVLLCGKTRAVVRDLCRRFETNAVEQEYLALVGGKPAEDKGTVSLAIGRDPGRPGRMRVQKSGGRRSRTDYEIVESWRGYSLLRVRPLTNRIHQIRVHLAAIGHPILSDPTYGGAQLMLSEIKPHYKFKRNRDELPLIRRLALHLHRLTVTHPGTGQPVAIESPLPKDFQICVKYLGKWA